MFRSPTVMIVGAGASCELDFPSGPKLREKIAQALDIKFETHQVSGSVHIAQAFRLLENSSERYDKNFLRHKAQEIKNGLSLAASIDTFLYLHREDQDFTLCGKLGIIESISEAERSSKLYSNPTESDLSLTKTQNTWLHPLFDILTTGITKSSLGKIGENLTIINFNYDRSLEYFLTKAFCTYLNCEESKAEEIVKQISIIHPYGTIGRLRSMNGNTPEVPYGSIIQPETLIKLTEKIKIYTEEIEENILIKQKIVEAVNLVFLGFGFHEQNMKLMKPHDVDYGKKVILSRFGISNSNCEEIKKEIELDFLSRKRPNIFEENIGCFNLLEDYKRTISK